MRRPIPLLRSRRVRMQVQVEVHLPPRSRLLGMARTAGFYKARKLIGARHIWRIWRI